MSFRSALVCCFLATLGCNPETGELVAQDVAANADSDATLEGELTARIHRDVQHTGLLRPGDVHRVTIEVPERMLIALDLESDHPVWVNPQGFHHNDEFSSDRIRYYVAGNLRNGEMTPLWLEAGVYSLEFRTSVDEITPETNTYLLNVAGVTSGTDDAPSTIENAPSISLDTTVTVDLDHGDIDVFRLEGNPTSIFYNRPGINEDNLGTEGNTIVADHYCMYLYDTDYELLSGSCNSDHFGRTSYGGGIGFVEFWGYYGLSLEAEIELNSSGH